MKTNSIGILPGLVLVFAAFAADAMDNALQPTGLPKGEPEELLPNNAVLHVRLNNPRATIVTLDKLIMSFVPHELVPPAKRANLSMPNPTLAYFGENAFGAPIKISDLQKIFGIDLARPITCSVYIGNNNPEIVVSVPVHDFNTFTRLLIHAVGARSTSLFVTNGQTYNVLRNTDFGKELFVVCSDNSAYICSSRKMADAVRQVGEPGKMKSNRVITGLIEENKDRDFVGIYNEGPLKNIVSSLLRQNERLPDIFLQNLRRELNRKIGRRGTRRLNSYLRSEYKIRDLDQLFDYAYCILSASYEVLTKSVAERLMKLDGVAVSVDVGNFYQQFTVTGMSDSIQPENSTRALPMDEVVKALNRLPSQYGILSISGRTPEPVPSKAFDGWLENMSRKLKAKELKSAWLDEYILYRKARRPVGELENIVDWRIRTDFPPDEPVEIGQFHSADDYLKAEFARYDAVAGSRMTIIPALGDEKLEAFYAKRNRINNDNEAAYKALLTATTGDNRFIDTEWRFRSETGANDLKRLITEKAWITRSGWFGYSQHELINRTITSCRTIEDYTLMQTQRKNGDERLSGQQLKDESLSPATRDLLEKLPSGCNQIYISHVLPLIRDEISLIASLETVVHNEIDAYLAECGRIIEKYPGDKNAARKEIEMLKMPFLVQSVHVNTKTGRPYCVLVGNLRYPRPKIMPLIVDLFSDYDKAADSTGGSVAYTRVTPGRFEAGYIQRTDGLALMITSVLNKFTTRYKLYETGPAQFVHAISVPSDGNRPDDPPLVSNLFWEPFLLKPVRKKHHVIHHRSLRDQELQKWQDSTDW